MTTTSNPSARSQTHSQTAKAALIGAAVATIGLVAMLVGYAAKWHGWGNDGTKDSGAQWSDIAWFMFAIGGTVAVVCAIVLLVKNRHHVWVPDRVVGLRVLIGLVVGIVAIALVTSLS